MTKAAGSFSRAAFTLMLVVAVFLFWWKGYPHALSYQEQYQLFLFDGGYFSGKLQVAGGLADYIGEFLTQFYFIPWLGALLLAVLFGLLQHLFYRLLRKLPPSSSAPSSFLFVLSFLPPVLLLWHMGDENVMLSYAVALCAALLTARLMMRTGWWADLLVVPLFYWLFGPMVWLYAALRVVQLGWRCAWMLLWVLAVEWLAYYTVLGQWPLETVLLTMCYYRIPMQTPVLQLLIPVLMVLIGLAGRLSLSRKGNMMVVTGGVIAVAVLAWLGPTKGYDREKYELIRQDYLIRNERWNEVIERAQRYQVRTPFSSVSVNLALGMTRQLADRMFDFYQSGPDALIMPRFRDMTSDLPSAEAFWRLGLVNSAQRYMFDIQESILNAKKSGRCTQRIVECMIVNGHYATARKHLALLKKSLFYRSWAEQAERIMSKEAWVNTHPVWGRMRKLRFKNDMLFSYPELEKVFGLLFINNPENTLALDYMMGQLLLKGNVNDFMRYMSWVQQYGGYRSMPVGYRNVVEGVQQPTGMAGSSSYARYVQQMKTDNEKE